MERAWNNRRKKLAVMVMTAALLHACGLKQRTGPPPRLSLAELQQEDWFEVQSRAGSFRVFLNRVAVDWVSGRNEEPRGARLLKLNRIRTVAEPTHVGATRWEGWRLELVQSGGSSSGGEPWEFYSFGPAEDLAAASVLQAKSSCHDCHRRIGWRRAPLFLGLYLTDLSPTVSRLRINKRNGIRQLVLE